MTKTYKLLKDGNIQDVATRTIYPPRRGTYLANAVIDELIAAGVVSEDKYGTLGFHPDGKLLITEITPEAPVAKTKKTKAA